MKDANLKEIELQSSIAYIADLNIDQFNNTPIAKILYERKMYCLDYMNNPNQYPEGYIQELVRYYNGKIRECLLII